MIHDFLERSSATPEFRDAVRAFAGSGMQNDLVRFDHRSPPVKVERVLTKLLASEGGAAIAAVELEGWSGCEFYRGQAFLTLADGAARRFRFRWDCRWRAIEEGWTDFFGFPDQMRAAQRFGYDCFQVWEEVTADEVATA